jgi:oxygen-independent coproporphyrinogen-3 oxidase
MTQSWATAQAGDERAAGLYLHIPFCRAKCHYCDFNTYAGIEDLIPAFVEALARQIEREAAAIDRAGRRLVSVFFGGGTPSLLTGRQVARLLEAAARAWELPAGVEVTLEANPGTLTPAALADLRAAGVNRLSLGAQTLQPSGLAALGRAHTAGDVLAGVAAARRAGFDNLNLDLIYGWMGQTEADWLADLEQVVALGVEHLSLYPLTVEAGTPLAAMVRRGQARVADDDEMAARYELAVAQLDAAGYAQYEVSNWARRDPGRPAAGAGATPRRACRHNLLYWRNEEYWAGGPGAHGHWSGRRWLVLKNPRQYVARVMAGEPVIAQAETIDPALAMAETMLLGLRLAEGVSRATFAARHGVSCEDRYGRELAELTAAGQLVQLGDRLVVPPPHRYLLDGIVARFLPDPAGVAG